MPNKRNVQSKQSEVPSKRFDESPYHITNFLRSIDRFGHPVPTFNIKGTNKIKTAFGGVLTALIMTFALGYFIIKFEALFKGADPVIN